MGGVAVLPPQDLLKERLPRLNLPNSSNFNPMKSRRGNPNSKSTPNHNPDSNPTPKSNPKSARSSNGSRKRSPKRLPKKTLSENQNPKNALVMGQVKILKRGEPLDQEILTTPMKDKISVVKIESFDDLVISSTDRLGPDPEMVTREVRIIGDIYAGPSSCVASPPPSSLPLPAFVKKSSVLTDENYTNASFDLRQMLRLDF